MDFLMLRLIAMNEMPSILKQFLEMFIILKFCTTVLHTYLACFCTWPIIYIYSLYYNVNMFIYCYK